MKVLRPLNYYCLILQENTSDTSHYENVPFEVPDGWCWCRLDTLCDIKGGKRVPRGMSFSDAPTSHVYIRVTNMKKNTIIDNELKYIDDEVFSYIRNYIISKSDLYLTIAGTIGDVGEVPDKYDMMNLTENAAKLTNIICNRKYLMYSLLSSHAQEHFSSKFHQVAQPKLSIETASSTFVPIPPMEEQKRIVAKIEELLTIIDLFDNSKLDLELAILHTKSKILDLAIHGKLVTQDPNDEPASELLKRINPKAVASCDNSHYGILPENWCWVKLGQLFNIISARRVTKDQWKSIGVPFYRTREIVQLSQNGHVDNELFIDIEHYESLKNKYGIPQPGDIMLTAVGTIGKTYVVSQDDKFYYKDASVLCMQNVHDINSQYIELAFCSTLVQKQLYEKSKGTTVDTITIEKANNYIFPIPPVEEQNRIVAKVNDLFSQLDMIEKSLQA